MLESRSGGIQLVEAVRKRSVQRLTASAVCCHELRIDGFTETAQSTQNATDTVRERKSCKRKYCNKKQKQTNLVSVATIKTDVVRFAWREVQKRSVIKFNASSQYGATSASGAHVNTGAASGNFSRSCATDFCNSCMRNRLFEPSCELSLTECELKCRYENNFKQPLTKMSIFSTT